MQHSRAQYPGSQSVTGISGIDMNIQQLMKVRLCLSVRVPVGVFDQLVRYEIDSRFVQTKRDTPPHSLHFIVA